jgi:hypothetical protein
MLFIVEYVTLLTLSPPPLAGAVLAAQRVDDTGLQLYAVAREIIQNLPDDLQANFTPVRLSVASSSTKSATKSFASTTLAEDEQTVAKLLELTPPSTPAFMDSSVCHQTNFFSPNQSILTPFGPRSYSTPTNNSSRQQGEEQQLQDTLYESDTHPGSETNQTSEEQEVNQRPVHVRRQSSRKRGIKPEYSGIE